MSDEKKWTDRDMILGARTAFIDGMWRQCGCDETPERCERFRAMAAAKYPLPKITRPREFVSPGGSKYRIADGTLQVWESHGWTSYWRVEMFEGIKALIANPTEEVEDDDSSLSRRGT